MRLVLDVAEELINIVEPFAEKKEPTLYDVLTAKDKSKDILVRLILASPPYEYRNYHSNLTLCIFYLYASLELLYRGMMSYNETLMDAADVLGEEAGRCFKQLPSKAKPPTPSIGRRCDPSCPDVCIPPPPPDLDCEDIPYRNFRVLPPDPHHFDADGDGIGCET